MGWAPSQQRHQAVETERGESSTLLSSITSTCSMPTHLRPDPLAVSPLLLWYDAEREKRKRGSIRHQVRQCGPAKSLSPKDHRHPNTYACPLTWCALDNDCAAHLCDAFLYGAHTEMPGEGASRVKASPNRLSICSGSAGPPPAWRGLPPVLLFPETRGAVRR